jgi:hypothetical protein
VALTKDRSAATQVTGTGQGSTLDLTSAYQSTLAIRHLNGTGTITVAATLVVEWRTEGGTVWFTLTTRRPVTTASTADEWTIELPDVAGEVRIDYTAPTGSTGHTLDYEVGRITAL